MATQSLFGPSAEEIMYQQQQDERDRQAVEFYRGLGAVDVPGVSTGMVFGRGIGQGLTQAVQGAFGTGPMQDPALAKATGIRDIFANMDIADMSDPDTLINLSGQLQKKGYLNEALYLTDRAAALRKQKADYDLARRKVEADAGMSPTTFNQFMDQINTDWKKDADKKLKAAKLGYQYYNQAIGAGPDKKRSSTAERLLNRELIKLSEDSQIGLTEIQNLVGGGDIGTKVANVFSELLQGTQSIGKLKEKLRLLQALEVLEAEKYNDKADSYRRLYTGIIDPFRLDEALQHYQLSPQAEEYLRMREEAQGLGGGDQYINVDDAEVLEFLGGGAASTNLGPV